MKLNLSKLIITIAAMFYVISLEGGYRGNMADAQYYLHVAILCALVALYARSYESKDVVKDATETQPVSEKTEYTIE